MQMCEFGGEGEASEAIAEGRPGERRPKWIFNKKKIIIEFTFNKKPKEKVSHMWKSVWSRLDASIYSRNDNAEILETGKLMRADPSSIRRASASDVVIPCPRIGSEAIEVIQWRMEELLDLVEGDCLLGKWRRVAPL